MVSDSDALAYLATKHYVAKDYKNAVKQAIEAGMNVRCTFTQPDKFIHPLRELVDEGSLSEEIIDERVRDVLRVKFLVGIFDNPYIADSKPSEEIVSCQQHQQMT